MPIGWLKQRTPSHIAFERHLPLGRLWLAFRVPCTNMYDLRQAIGKWFDDAWAVMENMHVELDYRTGTQMIGEWERALSLPEKCFPDAQTIEDRRFWIAFRLDKRRWTTAQDWHDLAALFGLTITITPGWYVQRPALYPMRYPKRYDLFPKLGRFRVYIDIGGYEPGGYPYGARADRADDGYPIPYGEQFERFAEFRCVLERVKPAHVVIIYNQFPNTQPDVPYVPRGLPYEAPREANS